jgi:hypothetical protein
MGPRHRESDGHDLIDACVRQPKARSVSSESIERTRWMNVRDIIPARGRGHAGYPPS